MGVASGIGSMRHAGWYTRCMDSVGNDPAFTVSDFVAVCNQTLEFSFPSIIIVGELANLRLSKNRWVYFDLKDDYSSVKFFGTVQQLPGPLEDGMLLQVRGAPRLHNLYGFSVNVQFMQPVGEGSIKKAHELLAVKLEAEGLFDPARKRSLPYPPAKIGLITSGESAAYRDFIKILNARWSGIEVLLADVQVQGEPAVGQVVRALEYFNAHDTGAEVVVLTRGGGSADDLAVFGTEQVTRAVAASRIPTLVAIGHEIDTSLAELAADQRASTPSNAAELLVPDKRDVLQDIHEAAQDLHDVVHAKLRDQQSQAGAVAQVLHDQVRRYLLLAKDQAVQRSELLGALSPLAALKRGYAALRTESAGMVHSVHDLYVGQSVRARMRDGTAQLTVERVEYDHE